MAIAGPTRIIGPLVEDQTLDGKKDISDNVAPDFTELMTASKSVCLTLLPSKCLIKFSNKIFKEKGRN